MNTTVFLTVMSGVVTYVLGQLVLKLAIEPVQEMRKTIAIISHSLIEHANIIQNPGVPPQEVMKETSQHLRRLSSQLHSHLYLVPCFTLTSWLFCLPTRANVLDASTALIGLSNSLYRAKDRIYEQNARRVEKVCDALGIYLAEEDR
jgi:hypothetical protein